MVSLCSFFFFFNDTATTEIYTLSLHDALPISIAEVLVIDGLTVAALFPLRAREPRAPFSVPGYPAVPILFIGVYLVLFIWTALGQSQSVLGTLAVLAGGEGVGRAGGGGRAPPSAPPRTLSPVVPGRGARARA